MAAPHFSSFSSLCSVSEDTSTVVDDLGSESKYVEIENERILLREENLQLAMKVDKLEEELQTKNEQIQNLHKQILNFNNLNDNNDEEKQKKEKEKLAEDLIEVKNENDKLIERNEELRKMLIEEKKEKMQIEKKYFENEGENIKLKGEKKILEKKEENLLTQIKELDEEVKMTKENNFNLRKQNAMLTVDLQQLNSKYEYKEKCCNEENEKNKQTIQLYEEKINKLNSEINQYNIKINKQNVHFQKSIKIKEEIINMKVDLIKNHEAKIVECIQKCDEWMNEKNSLLFRLEEEKKENEAKDKKIKELEKQIEKYKIDLKQKEECRLKEEEKLKKLKEINTSYSFSSEGNVCLEEKLITVISELELKNKQLKEFRTEKICMEEQLNKFRGKENYYEFLENELTNLRLSHDSLNFHLSKNQDTINALKDDIQQYAFLSKKYEEKCEVYKRRCNELLEELSNLMYKSEFMQKKENSEIQNQERNKNEKTFATYVDVVKQNNDLKMQIETLKKINESEEEKKLTEIENEVMVYKGKLDELINEKNAFVTCTQKTMKQIIEQRDMYKEEIDSLKKSIIEKKNVIEENEKKKGNEKSIQKLFSQMQNFSEELQKMQKEQIKTFEEKNEIQQKYVFSKINADFYEKQIQNFEKRVYEMQEEIKEKTRKIKDEEDEKEKVRKEKEKIEDELSIEKNHTNGLNKQIDNFISQIKFEKANVQDLHHKIQTIIFDENQKRKTLEDILLNTKAQLSIQTNMCEKNMQRYEKDIEQKNEQMKTLNENIQNEIKSKKILQEEIQEKQKELLKLIKYIKELEVENISLKSEINERKKQVDFVLTNSNFVLSNTSSTLGVNYSCMSSVSNQSSSYNYASSVSSSSSSLSSLSICSASLSQDSSNLVNQLSEKAEEIKKFQRQIEQLTAELSEANSTKLHWKDLANKNIFDLENLNKNVADLKEDIEQKKIRIEMLENSNQELHDQNNLIEIGLKETTNTLAEVKKQLEEEERRVKKKEEENKEESEAYIKQIDLLKKQNEFHVKEKEKLEEELRNEIVIHSRDISKIKEYESIIQIKKENEKKYLQEIQTKDSLINSIKEENKNEVILLEKQKDFLNNENTRIKKDYQNLQNIFNDQVLEKITDDVLRMRIKEVNLQKAEIEEDLENCKILIAELESNKNAYTREINHLKDKNENQQIKLKELEIELESYRVSLEVIAENSSLRFHIDKLKNDLESEKKNCAEYKNRLNTELSRLMPYKSEIEKLKNEVNDLKLKNESVQKISKVWESNYNELLSTYQSVDLEEVKKLKETTETLNKEKNDILQKLKRAEDGNSNLARRNTELTQSLQRANCAQQKLVSENNFLNSVKSDKEKLKNLLESKEKEITILKSEYENYKNSHNVSKMQNEIALLKQKINAMQLRINAFLKEKQQSQMIQHQANVNNSRNESSVDDRSNATGKGVCNSANMIGEKLSAAIVRSAKLTVLSNEVVKNVLQSAKANAQEMQVHQQKESMSNEAATVAWKKVQELKEKIRTDDESIGKLREEKERYEQQINELIQSNEKIKIQNEDFVKELMKLQDEVNNLSNLTILNKDKVNEKDEIINEINSEKQLLMIKFKDTIESKERNIQSLNQKVCECEKVVISLKEENSLLLLQKNNLKEQYKHLCDLHVRNAGKENELKLLSDLETPSSEFLGDSSIPNIILHCTSPSKEQDQRLAHQGVLSQEQQHTQAEIEKFKLGEVQAHEQFVLQQQPELKQLQWRSQKIETAEATQEHSSIIMQQLHQKSQLVEQHQALQPSLKKLQQLKHQPISEEQQQQQQAPRQNPQGAETSILLQQPLTKQLVEQQQKIDIPLEKTDLQETPKTKQLHKETKALQQEQHHHLAASQSFPQEQLLETSQTKENNQKQNKIPPEPNSAKQLLHSINFDEQVDDCWQLHSHQCGVKQLKQSELQPSGSVSLSNAYSESSEEPSFAVSDITGLSQKQNEREEQYDLSFSVQGSDSNAVAAQLIQENVEMKATETESRINPNVETQHETSLQAVSSNSDLEAAAVLEKQQEKGRQQQYFQILQAEKVNNAKKNSVEFPVSTVAQLSQSVVEMQNIEDEMQIAQQNEEYNREKEASECFEERIETKAKGVQRQIVEDVAEKEKGEAQQTEDEEEEFEEVRQQENEEMEQQEEFKEDYNEVELVMSHIFQEEEENEENLGTNIEEVISIDLEEQEGKKEDDMEEEEEQEEEEQEEEQEEEDDMEEEEQEEEEQEKEEQEEEEQEGEARENEQVYGKDSVNDNNDEDGNERCIINVDTEDEQEILAREIEELGEETIYKEEKIADTDTQDGRQEDEDDEKETLRKCFKRTISSVESLTGEANQLIKKEKTRKKQAAEEEDNSICFIGEMKNAEDENVQKYVLQIFGKGGEQQQDGKNEEGNDEGRETSPQKNLAEEKENEEILERVEDLECVVHASQIENRQDEGLPEVGTSEEEGEAEENQEETIENDDAEPEAEQQKQKMNENAIQGEKQDFEGIEDYREEKDFFAGEENFEDSANSFSSQISETSKEENRCDQEGA